MSGEPELLAPTTQETAPAADAAPPVAPPEAEEPDVIEIPTGEKLVPLSALTGARESLKATKAELAAAKEQAQQTAAQIARVQELESRVAELSPRAQAYDAALQAQQRPQQPQGPTPEEKTELEEIAKDLDFYRTDGSLDLERAQRFQQREQRRAEKIAQQHVEPFAAQTVAQASHHMLERALVTKAPDGAQPDPAVLKEVWSRLDRRLTATPEGAAQAFSVALGHSALLGKMKGGATAKAAEVIPPPLETERAGGREGGEQTHLRDSDRRAARDMGMTDKEYAAVLKDMPNGWGKGS